eukprot:TRINITY_DN596_c0_g5_i1.p1 TRINITY_DN596_c0_g5~~TRINITY_DN596_c0_g5_i1.p1  ORF type:complete len:301 (-),score=53.91 TRINITY_DN596_c0_g5_i1:742-1644(-)
MSQADSPVQVSDIITQVSREQPTIPTNEQSAIASQHPQTSQTGYGVQSQNQSDSVNIPTKKPEAKPRISWCERIFCCFCGSQEEIESSQQGYSGAVPGHQNQRIAQSQSVDDALGLDSGVLLPALAPDFASKKTIVLDLDETLVHSSFKPVPGADFVIDIEIEGIEHRVYVCKRPHVEAFLAEMGKIYEVVVFTASLSKYADPVLDLLDPLRVVKHRLFRESCTYHMGNFVKDLTRLNRRMEDIFIIDNAPIAYLFQPENAIAITSWFDDLNDTELLEMIPFLRELAQVDDVRTLLVDKH